ncbi:Dml [Symbiodinium natans]|uniref:Dml protein n=1 Tax=Symbiodinium natans TaxID=878477 RepID=A0A812J9V8_9DINO|nr:Dml [Symbiodinium natans]
MQMSPAARLRKLLAEARGERRCELIPACHDALSAVLIQRAGFPIAFMSGYAVSATQLACPDVGLISYAEQVQVGRNICAAVGPEMCVIGDGDTGFGGSGNVRRTVRGYADAGFAGITIEDQCYPKRCAYAKGLAVVEREEACARLAAALAARDELRTEGKDLVIIGRTDCRHAASNGGFEEALTRCRAFAELGADVVYAEGLSDKAEMMRLTSDIQVPTMLAQVEKPDVHLIDAEEAGRLGFTMSLLGLAVLNVAMCAMKRGLGEMKQGKHPEVQSRLSFSELYREVGFEEHYAWEEKFEGRRDWPHPKAKL